MDLYTKGAETKVFKPDGKIHANSPIRGIGTKVPVTGGRATIPDRGECYRLSNLTNAYISTGDLTSTPPGPAPGPDPGAQRAVITLTETDGRVRYFDERL